jgi:FkbM family methyltransferase
MRTIDDHTFDNRLLLGGGWVIDAGCRGFNFTNHCLETGNVYALDIEDFSESCDVSPVRKNFKQFKFKQAALTHFTGQTECYMFGNGTGNFIKGVNQEPGNSEDRPVKTITVPAITLQDIYKEIGTDIDLLKLDIEGAEYEILENLEPIPKQISVEFHQHVHDHLHRQYIDKVLEHLCKSYHMNLYIREWPRYLFMDCLFIRKDLV